MYLEAPTEFVELVVAYEVRLDVPQKALERPAVSEALPEGVEPRNRISEPGRSRPRWLRSQQT